VKQFYIVLFGRDAATIGASASAIRGAYHGVELILMKWINKLEHKDYIERLAETLSNMRGMKTESVLHPQSTQTGTWM
jgi:ADP-ribosylglycohydrolase